MRRKNGCVCSGLAAIMVVPVLLNSSPRAPAGQHATETAPLSILFVTSQHMLGSARDPFLVAPKYKRELEDQGWAVGYATLSALTWETLKRFNVVVVQQHPDVERYRL